MTSKVLKANGQVIYTLTYHALTDDEMANPEEIKARDTFDAAVTIKLCASIFKNDLPSQDIDMESPTFELYEDDDNPPLLLPEVKKLTLTLEPKLIFPLGGGGGGGRAVLEGTVKRHARDTNGNLHGRANINPILDMRTCEVEFSDRRTAEFSANAIAEHMFTQCDPAGNQYLLLDSIINHEIDDTAVTDRD